MNRVRAFFRLLLFVIIIIYRIAIAVTGRLLRPNDREWIPNQFRLWGSNTLKAMGVEVEIRGELPAEAALILPNHRSYIDIIFFPIHVQPSCFVAKADIDGWPLIGAGARLVKTIFVDRSNQESRRQTREDVKDRLKEGYSVIVFPEGTTFQAPDLGKFYPGMFFIAAEGDIPVIPAAIEYYDPEDAWAGSESLLQHYFRAFGKRKTKVKIEFGPVMKHQDGEVLKQKTETWIASSLKEIQQEWGMEFE